MRSSRTFDDIRRALGAAAFATIVAGTDSTGGDPAGTAHASPEPFAGA